ncbi:DUF6680 family protein [Prolixibacter denitrificans]|uniref:DUF6680 domain-containing protein n=1 Tax=Prolixibacter denitrificans TaxID=1541063 RepID=A0A2P8CE49_9BACT|nr:DUF6680 family protein [Prolixibacter denitrificans]PSK83258.1 hypothetical protein CLV93_104188 [Prolixibacter denitrificans]GET21859.1 hypothetical protein JCM18694_21050 [Prolixibacter denitrificans]
MNDSSELVHVVIDSDLFAYLTFGISTLILLVTALAVWRAPIKAVEIGKKLSDKQKKDEDKRKLFLTLFALRGTPVNYDFVMGLNQIEIVFQGHDSVIKAWRTLRLELQKDETEEQRKICMDRTYKLLKQMASDLDYPETNESMDTYHYYPKGFEFLAMRDNNLKLAQSDYYKRSIEFYDLMTEVYQEALLQKQKQKDAQQ